MTWKPYPAYKPSRVEWLGDVPAGWEVKRGRFVMQINPRIERVTSGGYSRCPGLAMLFMR